MVHEAEALKPDKVPTSSLGRPAYVNDSTEFCRLIGSVAKTGKVLIAKRRRVPQSFG